MFQHLEISSPAERVQQITIQRPRQFNALAKLTIQELHTAIAEFEKSGDDILILTGSGRFFCFGADFTEFQDRSQLPVLLQMFQDLIVKIFQCSKVTIACLNGHASGAGLDLALACDFRTMSDKAKLSEAYISMGLVPDGGGSCLLTRIVGVSRALELFISGEAVPAEQAKNLGIVHHVIPPEHLSAKTVEFASSLAAKPQTALRLTKRLVKENAATSLKSALEHEREAQMICFEDETHQEIVRQFLKKRSKAD